MVVDRSISNRALTRFAVVASNLLPLLGVFLLDWSAHTLLGIFVLELCVVVFWTVVKTPFAEKRPHNGLENSSKLFGPLQAKRGAIRLSRRLPPVYPRNLPLMLMLAFILGPLELVVGFIVFALSEPGVTTAMVASLFVGGIAVFCSRGVEFWAEYMRNEAYRDHSPRSLALTPLKQFFGVGLLFVCLLFLSAGTAETGQSIIGGNVLLTVIVGVKLAYELRSTSLAETNDKRGIFTRLYGSHRTEIEPIPVETPDAEPKMYVKPRFGAMVVDSLYHGSSTH